MNVGLVIVSHSSKIAEGVCDLARQMAADVRLVAAGGVEDAGGVMRIGTSFDKVLTAISSADSGAGVVVLTDLGSAVMTAEMALEFLDSELRDRVRLARAALVEGAVAAAVESQTGADADAVVSAAEAAVVALDPVALEPFVSHAAAAPGDAPGNQAVAVEDAPVEGSWELPNPMGLHARPAATLARAMSELDADVTVNGVDAKSVMLLMSLGLGQGKVLTASAAGPDAQKAIDQIGREVTSGFGELAEG